MSKTDPYKTLGVSKTSTDADIKKAYRKLAREYHPDRNPNDKAAEEKFKEIQTAYQVIIKPVQPVQQSNSSATANVGSDSEEAFGYASYFEEDETAGVSNREVLDEDPYQVDNNPYHIDYRLHSSWYSPTPGENIIATLKIDFLKALKGGVEKIEIERKNPCPKCLDQSPEKHECFVCHALGYLQETTNLTIKIPPATATGQKLRLTEQGDIGKYGGNRGDVLVIATVEDHPLYQRIDRDLWLEIPLSLQEAYYGARVVVPGPWEDIELEVEAQTFNQNYHIANQGVPLKNPTAEHSHGELICSFKVVLPQIPTDVLTKESVQDFFKEVASEDVRESWPDEDIT